ncbi:MAG: glutaminyl-peptide cyclotransferase [Proteobacteria bacterium]|nr:glutaminyl-peptide cyclotransferase [Pseudomonadota bacterium]MBU1612603.1 glutaminyl-peptide cyclotransferase [Pseudomonadota bacterium]
MRRSFPRMGILLLALCFLGLIALGTAYCSEPGHSAPIHTVRIHSTLPHDPEAFTQGLFLHQGLLYESTGNYGSSTVRSTDPATGRIIQLERLQDDQFGEGLARLGDTVIQLTWKEGVGLVYDLQTLKPVHSFRYQGEGWGLASVPGKEASLVKSDGSSTLTFLSSDALAPVRTITVRDGERKVSSLNEMEWYRGVILANQWFSDEIAAIDPESGEVVAWIDLAPLRDKLRKGAGVANGIAYDPATDQLLVTGKNWERVFEIEILPALTKR